MTVLQILDEIPSNTTAGASDWYPQVEHALGSPDEWVTAIARIGELSDEHAWSLLSWIEVAASRIVRTDSRGTLVSAAFAMCLVLQSQLDRRDCSVVASLLRRAAEISILDFAACVAEGCGQAGSMGQEASRLLLDASPTTPATHVESGDGETFLFERRTPDFDVDDLERWLEGEGDV